MPAGARLVAYRYEVIPFFYFIWEQMFEQLQE